MNYRDLATLTLFSKKGYPLKWIRYQSKERYGEWGLPSSFYWTLQDIQQTKKGNWKAKLAPPSSDKSGCDLRLKIKAKSFQGLFAKAFQEVNPTVSLDLEAPLLVTELS